MHLQDCIRYDCTYSKYTMNNDGWSERVGPSNKIASWGINTRRKMSGGKKKNHNRGYYKQIKEKKLLDQRWEETAEGSITWIRSSIHRSDWIGGENPGSGSDTTLWLLIWRFSNSQKGQEIVPVRSLQAEQGEVWKNLFLSETRMLNYMSLFHLFTESLEL